MRELDRPVLLDAAHARRVALELGCQADGSLAWRYTISPISRMAFLSRRVSTEIPLPAIESANQSPLRELARQAYLDPDLRIAGELPAPDVGVGHEVWPGVVIRAK